MSAWTRLHPKAPGDMALTVSVAQLKHTQVLRVRIPRSICAEFEIEEDDDFNVQLDAAGRRVRFQLDQAGDVSAKAYGKNPKPGAPLTIAVGLLRFETLFAKTKAEWERIDGDLVVTLPQQARAA